VIKGINRQEGPERDIHEVVSQITSIIEKYTDHIDLLDIIDIVDNLRILMELAEKKRSQSKCVNVA
jgi:hypothetical protein